MCRSQSQPVLSMKVVNENQHEKKKIKLKKKKKKFTLAANVSMTRYNLGMKNKLFLMRVIRILVICQRLMEI